MQIKSLMLPIFMLLSYAAISQTAGFSITGSDNNYCLNDTIVFTNTSTSYINQKWKFGDGYESYFENPKHKYSETGNYTITLTVFSSSGNQNSISKNITINKLPTLALDPQNDTTIYTGTSIKITASGNFDNIFWSTGETDKEIYLSSSGIYSVMVTENKHNCTNYDTITVKVQNTENTNIKIETINNVLTPNQDGVNDFLFIKDLDNIQQKCEISIYGKSGNLLFYDNDYKNNWAGKTNNGEKLPSGTYYYVIKIKNKIGGTGFVDIIF